MGFDIPINMAAFETADQLLPSKTPFIDFAAGRIVGYCDELAAIKQYITLALLTPRFRFLIYDNQYGSEIESLIENSFDEGLFQSEATRFIKETLSDERITKVYDFDFSFVRDSQCVRFSVDTVFGNLSGLEVNINV